MGSDDVMEDHHPLSHWDQVPHDEWFRRWWWRDSSSRYIGSFLFTPSSFAIDLMVRFSPTDRSQSPVAPPAYEHRAAAAGGGSRRLQQHPQPATLRHRRSGYPPQQRLSASSRLSAAATRLSASTTRLSTAAAATRHSSRLPPQQPGYPPQQPGYRRSNLAIRHNKRLSPPRQPGYPPQQPGYPPQQPGYPPQQPGYPPQQPGYPPQQPGYPPQPAAAAALFVYARGSGPRSLEDLARVRCLFRWLLSARCDRLVLQDARLSMQQVQSLQQHFAYADRDRSGTLSRSELEQLWRNAFQVVCPWWLSYCTGVCVLIHDVCRSRTNACLI